MRIDAALLLIAPHYLRRFFTILFFVFSAARIFSAAGDEHWQSGFVLPPGVDAPVNAMAVIGQDLYVGGSFEKAGGLTVNGLARWDGTNWHAVGGGVHGTVHALAVAGTNLYVGGEFDRAGELNATNLACWNGQEWQAIGNVTGQGFTVFGNYRVLTMLASGRKLYVGGNFQEVGGVAATNIARWNGTNWFPIGPGVGSGGGHVSALAKRGSRLFAGGLFFNAGDTPANNIAYWNGKAWRPLGAGLTGGGRVYLIDSVERSGVVESLAFRHGVLFAGGQFSRAGHRHATNLARWVSGRWLPMGRGVGTASAESGVSSLTVRGRDLYVAGLFERASLFAATNLVRWNGRRWFDIGGGVNGNGVLAFLGTRLYVGGDFGVAGGVSAGHVAHWNGQRWSALGEGGGNTIMGVPTTIAASGRDVFVAGYIHTAGTNAVRNVARWDGTNWFSLGHGFSTGRLSASAVSGSNYYVIGDFVLPEIGATNIACWNGTAWTALGSGARQGERPGQLTALAVDGDMIYVAGYFTSIGGVTATNVAVWNGWQWSAVGDLRYAGRHPASVRVLAARSGELYAAGLSGAIGYEDFVVQWNGQDWLPRWSRPFLGSSPQISKLGFDASGLYAFGHFTDVMGLVATNIARWDGTNWTDAGLPFGQDTELRAHATSPGYLYVGGNLTEAAGTPATSIARYDGATWSALGSGLIDQNGRGYTLGLAASAGRVYAIGYFRTAGGKPSYRFAVWNEPQ